jgi:Mg2+ and Co2+ transporter CorA
MEGMLKTVSVGFIPLKRNEQDYKIIEKAELLEVSFVAVPCNPNAVSLDQKVYDEAVSKGLIVEQIDEEVVDTAEVIITQLQSEIKEIKDILKAMADDKAKEKELSEEIERVKAQKELLQKINNATASALQNLKML